MTDQQHIIWDLDNTIYAYPDPVVPWFYNGLYLALAERHGVDEFSKEQIIEMGMRSFRRHGSGTKIFADMYGLDARQLLGDWYDYVPIDPIATCPDTTALFEKSDHRHGILTHAFTKWAHRVLDHHDIRHHFADDAIIGIEQVDFSWKHKSDRPVKLALDRLGAMADDTMMVEDHVRNLKPAKELGLYTVLVTQDQNLDDHGQCLVDVPDHVDLVVSNAADLLQKLND